MASFRKMGDVWHEWKETSKSGYKTKKEAQIASRQKEIEVMNGFEQGEMNFAIYMRAWLNQYVKDKLKPMMYQKFIDGKLEEGLSTETARRIHNVVYQAFKRALINGYVTKNPCEHVSIKRCELKKLKFLEPKLVAPLVKALYKRGQIYGLFFKLLFDTGLRKEKPQLYSGRILIGRIEQLQLKIRWISNQKMTTLY